MKKTLCKLVNKVASVYGGMVSNASTFFIVGQTKTPACLIKKD
jgi:cyclic lactone autoinducer peptide